MSNLSLVKKSQDIIKLSADKVIFTEGELLKYLFILKKGEILLTKNTGQHLVITKICGEKEILNEVSILTNVPVDFSAITRTSVELVLIEKKDILSVIQAGPLWVMEIFETLCERLKSTQNIIEEHHLLADLRNANMVLSREDEKKYLKALAEYSSPI